MDPVATAISAFDGIEQKSKEEIVLHECLSCHKKVEKLVESPFRGGTLVACRDCRQKFKRDTFTRMYGSVNLDGIELALELTRELMRKV